MEKRAKFAEKHHKARLKAIDVREEQANKSLDGCLVSAEKRSKRFAEAHNARSHEKLARGAGVTNRALELAQADALQAQAVAFKREKDVKQQSEKLVKKKQAAAQQQAAAEKAKKQEAQAQQAKKVSAEKSAKKQTSAAAEAKKKAAIWRCEQAASRISCRSGPGAAAPAQLRRRWPADLRA